MKNINEYLLSKRKNKSNTIDLLNEDMKYEEFMDVLESSDYEFAYDETGTYGIDKEVYEILKDVKLPKIYAKQDHTQYKYVSKVIRIMNKQSSESSIMFSVLFNENKKLKKIYKQKFNSNNLIEETNDSNIDDLKKYMKE